jgi:hypothetical protein
MIPPSVDERCSSPGERELFSRFESCSLTNDWIVLHSLDLANHPSQVEGEVDFVLLIPKVGVLCLEVKAHLRIELRQGGWYFGSSREPEFRGPFKQAKAGCHSIRGYLTSRMPRLAEVPIRSAVCFPYVDFSETSPEWHTWELVDRRRLYSAPIGKVFEGVMRQARSHLALKGLIFRDGEPSNELCEEIARLLRPKFEAFESPRARAERRNFELKRFTSDQFAALDRMRRNPQVVFEGPAGTGKTFLAVEAARRAAAAGAKVLFLCFNKLLGSMLEREMDPVADNVWAGTFHRFLAHEARRGSGKLQNSSDPDYFDTVLPDLALDAICKTERIGYFDQLVVDEAQDLLSKTAFETIADAILAKGLSGGIWRFFGDFENQAIYGHRSIEEIQEAYPRSSVCTLETNCRNLPRIAQWASIMGSLAPGYREILRGDDGVEPSFHFYGTEKEQTALLISHLQRLWTDGFRGRDVVVLSFKRETSCALSLVEAPWAQRVRPVDSAADQQTSFTTVHAFKGLEAGAIILTDVDDLESKDKVALLYTGVSRAQDRLVILAHQRVRATLKKLLIGGGDSK